MDRIVQIYLNNDFKQVIETLQNPAFIQTLSLAEKLHARWLLLNSFLNLKEYTKVVSEITNDDADCLIATKLLALYLITPDERILEQALNVCQQVGKGDAMTMISLATLFINGGKYIKALELLNMFPLDPIAKTLNSLGLCLINHPEPSFEQYWVGLFTKTYGNLLHYYQNIENKNAFLKLYEGLGMLHTGQPQSFNIIVEAFNMEPENSIID